MKLEKSRPVCILIIGAGGTGGYILPNLYRIAYATKRKYRVVIADGDIVEKKNLITQIWQNSHIVIQIVMAYGRKHLPAVLWL